MKKNNFNNYPVVTHWEKSKWPLVAIGLLGYIAILGFIAIFIGLSPQILFVIYGVFIAIPFAVILVNRDLFLGLSAWFLLVLFSKVGKITLPLVPDIEPHRLLWILVFLFLLAQIALKKRRMLPITKIEVAMMLFCLVCLMSMMRAKTLFVAGQGLTIRSFLEGYGIPFSIFFLTKNIVQNEQQIKKLFQILFIVGIYLTMTGIFEHFHLRALVFPRYIMDPSLHVHWGRARGPFINAAANGAAIGMLFLIGLYIVIHMRKNISRKINLFFIPLMPITIFFTYTRSSWLGFILSILMIPIFFRGLRKILILGLCILIVIVILNWSGVSSKDRYRGGITYMNPVYQRVTLYAASARMFLDRPIFGFGFGSFQEQSYDYLEKVEGIPVKLRTFGRHDTLVGILVELGLMGFIPLILIFYYIFKQSVRLYRKLGHELFLGKGLVVLFWGIGIILLVTFQAHEMRFFLLPNSIFYAAAGIIVGLNQRIYAEDKFASSIPAERVETF